MSDILSGGAIDESTSGPIPPKVDDRQRDVLEEQRIRQEQEAIGGTQFPPTTEPPPFIPEPPQIAPPPLPDIDIPSLGIDFGGAAEVTREIARQTAIDVLKRVTIDGQTPVIEGSSISFNTSRRSVASEDFGTGGNADFIQPAFSQGRLDAADFGSRAAMEDRSSANAYAAAEARRDERRMSDPSFDGESPIRQRGETMTEFRERQEQIREGASLKQIESPDVLDNESVLTRDISGPIAVSLIRADGNGRVFAFLRSENAEEGEPTLPKSEYWVGVPDGITHGDILYWETSEDTPKWKVLEAPENATIAIEEFSVCENGVPKTKNMLVWNTPD